jgi:hypothetical protein
MLKYCSLPDNSPLERWAEALFKNTELYSFCNFKLSVDTVKITDDSVDATFEYPLMSASSNVKKYVDNFGQEYKNVLYDIRDAKKFYVNSDDVDELIYIIAINAYKNIQIIISGGDRFEKCAIAILDKYKLFTDTESLYINFSGNFDKYYLVMELMKDKMMEIYEQHNLQNLYQQDNSPKSSRATSASQSRKSSTSDAPPIAIGLSNLAQNIHQQSEKDDEETDIMKTYWNTPLLYETDKTVSVKSEANDYDECEYVIRDCQKKKWTPDGGFKPFYDHLNTGIRHSCSETYLGFDSEALCAASLLKPASNNDAPKGYFKICFIMKNNGKVDFFHERICAQTNVNMPTSEILLNQIPEPLFEDYINSYDVNSYVKSIFINGNKYESDIPNFFSERIKKLNVPISDHKKINIYITKNNNDTELKIEHEITEDIVKTETKHETFVPAYNLIEPVANPANRIPYQVPKDTIYKDRKPCYYGNDCHIGLDDSNNLHNEMFAHYNDIPYKPEPAYTIGPDPSTLIKLDDDDALVTYKVIQDGNLRNDIKCIYENSIKMKKDDLLRMTWKTLFEQIGLYDGKTYGLTYVNNIPTTKSPMFYINSARIVSNVHLFDTMAINEILFIKKKNQPIKICLQLYESSKKLYFVIPTNANCNLMSENL